MDENNEVLVAVREVVKKVDEGFARVDQQFAKVDEQFAKVDERFAKVDERFARVEERFAKVDEQFVSFRSQISKDLDEKIRHTHLLIEDLRRDMASVGEGVNVMNEKLDGPQDAPLDVRVSALEVRVTRLEKKRRN